MQRRGPFALTLFGLITASHGSSVPHAASLKTTDPQTLFSGWLSLFSSLFLVPGFVVCHSFFSELQLCHNAKVCCSIHPKVIEIPQLPLSCLQVHGEMRRKIEIISRQWPHGRPRGPGEGDRDLFIHIMMHIMRGASQGADRRSCHLALFNDCC